MQLSALDENQLPLLNAINDDFILHWLPDGTIISGNLKLCEFLGKSDQDFGGKSIFTFIFNPDLARVQSYISAFGQSASRNSIDYRVINKNGEMQWLHWRDFYQYDTQFQRYEFLSIGHAISSVITLNLHDKHFKNLDRLVTTLSVNFIDVEPESLDIEINKSLQMVGEFAQVDRSYVFLYSEDGNFMTNTHEWCAPGIEPQISQIQNFPVNRVPWLHNIFSNFGLIHIPNVDELPEEASAEKEIFQTQSILSMVVVPIEYSKKLIGFVGFDSVCCQKNWAEEDITLLQIFGSIIGRAIIQVKNKKELLIRERFFQKLNEISLASMNSKDIQDMMDVIANQLKYIIMADGCFITLWDDQKKVVIPFAASEPFSKTYKKLQIQPEEKTVTHYVLENERFLIVDDVLNSSLLSPRIAHSFSSRCLLGIPLINEGRKLGAILLSFNEYHHFSQEEIALAQQSAYMVSLAISKQLALEEAERYAREIEILRNSGMIVASTLEPELAIDRILDQLDQVIPFDYSTVQLLVDQKLEIRAGKGWPDPKRIEGLQIPIPGDNPNTIVIQTQQPHLIADAQIQYKSFRDIPNVQVHSWLGAPLIVNNKVIGMITLEKSEKNFFTQYHLQLARAFADQVAISLNNAQLFKIEERRVLELNTLRATLFDISNELELTQLLPAIVKRATDLMHANGGELGLYNQENKEIKIVISQSVGKELTDTVLVPGEGMFGKVAETLQPLIIQNYMEWDNHVQAYDSEMVHSVIAAPLLIGKQLLGVIGIARTVSNEPFTENDLILLSLFAQQAAIAINNANLYNEVEKLTKIDALTGLYNRRGLNELSHRELVRALRSNNPMAMFMIDIDYFKYVNDHYGHPIGDQILILLSDELQKNVREMDILCRYGGEEFAVLLPETNVQTAKNIAERLRIYVENHLFKVQDLVLNITISIGVSWMPGKIASIDSLLNRADSAMYLAKRSGRNKVCVFNEI